MRIILAGSKGLNGPISAQLHSEAFESSALLVLTKSQCLQVTKATNSCVESYTNGRHLSK